MSAYIDKEYLENLIGPGELSGCLHYGGTPTSQTGSVVTQFIAASSDYVDSFVENAGYDVPLSTVPANIKLIVSWHVYRSLLLRANRPIPDALEQEIRTGNGYLLELAKGTISLPGVAEDEEGAPQGGSSFSATDDAPSYFGKGLRGVY